MKKKPIRALGISLAAVTLVTSVGTMSMAASQTNGSDGPLHIYQSGATLVSPADSFAWDDEVTASSSSTEATAITCPAGDGFRTFISPRGSEENLENHTGWNYFAGQPSGLQFITPSGFIQGAAAGAKSLGGQFSLGIACTSSNGTAVVSNGVFYRHVTVTQGSGAMLAAATVDVAPAATSTTANRNGSVSLSATTIASADGTLSLSVPQGASVTFGTATLNAGNRSTSTGTLPQITVQDDRITSRLGWDLQTNVAAFVSGANTIASTNLAITPSIVANAGGVTVASTPLAGSASYPFEIADAALDNGVGTTTISGGLTFVAPVGAPAGTYTSTLTLTLVSK